MKQMLPNSIKHGIEGKCLLQFKGQLWEVWLTSTIQPEWDLEIQSYYASNRIKSLPSQENIVNLKFPTRI
jgi:hypothetical protein